MSKIIYRKMEKRDYADVMSLMNISFGLYKYVNNDKLLKNLLKGYLQSCLAEKTFSCVADKNGKVMGVILGQAKSKYNVFASLPHMLKSVYYNSFLAVQSIIHKNSSKDFRKLHQIYNELISGKEKDFDGVLSLFIVKEECRGLGVGKKLLGNLLNYLEANNTKNIYLYTDTTCNFGFYESQGFKRFGEKPMQITRENKLTDIDVFAYKYNLS